LQAFGKYYVKIPENFSSEKIYITFVVIYEPLVNSPARIYVSFYFLEQILSGNAKRVFEKLSEVRFQEILVLLFPSAPRLLCPSAQYHTDLSSSLVILVIPLPAPKAAMTVLVAKAELAVLVLASKTF
jgi:hypothetical protein